MTPKTDIRKLKFGQLPILGAWAVAMGLAPILAYWGTTSILTFLVSDTGVEEKMTSLPARSTDMRAKLNSGTLSEESPQQAPDRLSMNVVRKEAAFSQLHETSFSQSAEPAPHTKDVEIRVDAIHGFRNIGDHRDVGPLIRALGDGSALVRSAAVDVLGDVGNERVVEFLTTALEDRDAKVRSSAVRALGKVGGDANVGDLARALFDSSPEVRIAGVEALKNLQGGKAIEFLTTALKDSDAQVREAAEVVLAEIIAQETEKALDDFRLQGRINGGWKEEGQPATPGLPGYLTDPPAEKILREGYRARSKWRRPFG